MLFVQGGEETNMEHKNRSDTISIPFEGVSQKLISTKNKCTCLYVGTFTKRLCLNERDLGHGQS